MQRSAVSAFVLAAAAVAATFVSAAFSGPALAAERETGLPDGAPARIEVVFVLDTTGSMSGLIEGAKRKIWSIASNMMDLEPQPEIRFGLIGYRDRGDVYVTKTYDLTEDVQSIYGKLLAFRADGGGDNPESVNQALSEAVNDLAWSQEDSVFRAIFLVGDAPPHMDYPGDTPYHATLKTAVARDIVVNAVQAGGQGRTTKIWREIATLGGGAFAQIAQDGAMTAIETPYDEEIEALNIQLNDTVVPYGGESERRATLGKVQTAKEAMGAAAADLNAYFTKKSLGRARSVVSGGGDLVEDLASGEVELDSVADERLPQALRELAPAERAEYVAERKAERADIRAKLDDLLAKRAAYIEARRAELAASPDAFDAEVDRMIETQAARKGFVKR